MNSKILALCLIIAITQINCNGYNYGYPRNLAVTNGLGALAASSNGLGYPGIGYGYPGFGNTAFAGYNGAAAINGFGNPYGGYGYPYGGLGYPYGVYGSPYGGYGNNAIAGYNGAAASNGIGYPYGGYGYGGYPGYGYGPQYASANNAYLNNDYLQQSYGNSNNVAATNYKDTIAQTYHSNNDYAQNGPNIGSYNAGASSGFAARP